MLKKIILSTIFLVLAFGSLTTLDASMQGADIKTCEIEVVHVKWWNIISPGEFLPIIPEDCGTTEDGKVAMLSPALIPDILFRLYGFLVSLMFMLILPVFTYAGVQWSWAGVFGEGQVQQAKALLKNSSLALVVVSIFYSSVMVILRFFGAQEILSSTDLSSFFNF